MKTLLATLLFLISCTPEMLAQTQLRQITPKAIQTKNVPGRYRSLITRSFKSYREVQVMRFTQTTITFTHADGMETLNMDDMPPEVQKACNYVPEGQTAPNASIAEQIEMVRRTEARRYVQVMEEVDGGFTCHVWGIGGSRDPQVMALKKQGKDLTQYKNEFIYPLHMTDRFAPGHEDAVVLGLKKSSDADSTVVLSLYLVKRGGPAEPYIYATSLTEAAKYLTEK